jgi:hypothetical protein
MSSTNIEDNINSSIKRPLNSFMFFAQKNRHSFSKKYPHMRNDTISILLGQEWIKLPPNERQHYVNLASEEKIRHQEKYPKYKYKPRIRRIKTDGLKIFKKRGRKRKVLAHEEPLIGYFENIHFSEYTSCKFFNTMNNENDSTESEDEFDLLEKYYKNMSLYSDHSKDEQNISSNKFISDFLLLHDMPSVESEELAYPTVYIPHEIEECSYPDMTILVNDYGINDYGINDYDQRWHDYEQINISTLF